MPVYTSTSKNFCYHVGIDWQLWQSIKTNATNELQLKAWRLKEREIVNSF